MMTQTACRQDWDSANLMSLYAELDDRPWNQRIMGDLTDVATLLDCLEVWGVPDRKVFTRDDGTFVVKWRD